MKELQKLLSKTRRAAEHYQMIADGDRIAVGVSGGKDSLALLLALKRMQSFYPVRYEVSALSIDPGFPNGEGLFDPVRRFCDSLGVAYHIEKTQIYDIVFTERAEKNPCSLCATMRRGALVNAARSLGVNSIALGHHTDDAVDTFLLSLVNEGRIGCFSPVTVYEDSGVRVIRPLLYAREYEVEAVARAENLPVVKSPCPEDGKTDRADTGEIRKLLAEGHRGIEEKILGALERRGIDGWYETEENITK